MKFDIMAHVRLKCHGYAAHLRLMRRLIVKNLKSGKMS